MTAINERTIDLLIRRHGVKTGQKENPIAHTLAGADVTLTDFQARLLDEDMPIRIASAPTGAGKTFAFELAPLIGKNVLVVVPTRRLAQNLEQEVRGNMRRNEWSEAEIKQRLAVWTSDAMADATASGMTSAEARAQRVRQLRAQDGFRENGSFIIATPESVGQLLLNPPCSGHGQPVMSLADLLLRDHIVFDEFHTIEPRGFGLACALCRIASDVSGEGHRPHVTFLSATPIRIADTLMAFDIPETEISVFEEHVDSWRLGEEPPDARIIHGDVEISLGHYPDILEACRGESDAISQALKSGQAVVVIFDSVAKLKGARDHLSGIFQAHGIPKDGILAINSIDDAHKALSDEHGVGGRTADPRQASVILATSSIEIGVTFSANLMIMDRGHNSCSFIQRIGRVSRGDLPGRVVVAGPVPPTMLVASRKLGNAGSVPRALIEVDIRTFVNAMLHNVAKEFVGKEGPLANELQTYGTMSNRAVWCACLFWTALRRVWVSYLGERATLWELQPRKVGLFEIMLKTLEKCDLERPKAWVKAFIREATRFRDIEPRVRVHHGGRFDSVPESMFGRYPELSGASCFEDKEGIFYELRQPLESILKTGDTKSFCTMMQPLAPLEGMPLSPVSRRSSARDFVHGLKRARRHSFGAKGDEVCKTVMTLVSMTGVVPQEDDTEDISMAHEGSGVL